MIWCGSSRAEAHPACVGWLSGTWYMYRYRGSTLLMMDTHGRRLLLMNDDCYPTQVPFGTH